MTLSNLLPKPANFNLTIFDHFVPLKASNSKIPKNDNFLDFWKHYIALTKPVFIGIIYIYVPSNFTPKFFLLKAFRDFWKFFFQPNDTVFEAFFFCTGQIYGTWTRYYKNHPRGFLSFFYNFEFDSRNQSYLAIMIVSYQSLVVTFENLTFTLLGGHI